MVIAETKIAGRLQMKSVIGSWKSAIAKTDEMEMVPYTLTPWTATVASVRQLALGRRTTAERGQESRDVGGVRAPATSRQNRDGY